MVLRMGIAGLGRIGRQQIACAGQLVGLQITAVADPAISSDCSLPGGIQRHHRWEDLIADRKLDAISICTPHHLHASIALAALQAGKHVLVEKPMGLSIEESAEVMQAAQRAGRVLMVELTHRFYPPIQEAMRQIQSGRLGRIFAAEDRIIEPAGGQIQPWLRQKSLAGGGVALTNGIHMLDRLAAVLGRPLRLIAGQAQISGELGDIEDAAAMLLTTPDRIPIQLLAAWPRGGGRCDDELTIYGEKGTLRAWAWRGWAFEPSNAADRPHNQQCYPTADDVEARVRVGITGALREFMAAIVEHRPPNPSAADALAAQQLVEQFYQFTGLHGDRP